ncbi:class I SAM-dependent methyltransferase [Microlunatus soli]|uniref:Methyltransferase domain-containing protein n=1 Tax=Microlunatus soli TaxID=630515 RepID=A0A1H1ZZP2_9ACTN|nr:class I SAM-dependent methyltransferase [Microlunatus soli]SDT39069.1 Methyltransferase domain-containing protein [Microlunatus soli]
MDENSAVNREFWDEIAPHHAGSDYYAIERFVASPDSLGLIEKSELGDVAGRSICHLQCHLGLDSLSLARLGADVTGVDFSGASLRIARELCERTRLPARFVESDVLTAAATLQTEYDIVFTTRGVLMWIGDLAGWADNCLRLLRPGGTFYLLDIHPLGMAVEQTGSGLRLASSYFGGGAPSITEEDASYAVSGVGLTHRETREWIHPVGEVVTALAGAGLVIEFLHEHPDDGYAPTTLSATADVAGVPELPALFSIRAHRPG